MTKIIKVIAIVCLWSFSIPMAYSTEKKNFIIGVQNFAEYLPYSQYKGKQYTGFNREVFDLFAETKGYTFEYQAFPIKRLYKQFLDGNVDLKYPDNSYWSAKLKEGKDIKYSDPLVEYIDGVMVVPEKKGDVQLKVLGVIRGFTPFPYLELIKEKSITIEENTGYKGLLKQTLNNRVDGAYSNIAVSQYYLEKEFKNSQALVFDSSLPHVRSQRFLSSFKHPELIEEFNQFLKDHSDAIARLKQQHRVEEGL